MHKALVSLLALGLLGFSAMVAATPDLKTIGEGSYRYLFWQLYDARLASVDGKFTDYENSSPLLLELTYKRDISREQFIDATVDEWKKLGRSTKTQQTAWASRLAILWQDVKKGE